MECAQLLMSAYPVLALLGAFVNVITIGHIAVGKQFDLKIYRKMLKRLAHTHRLVKVAAHFMM